MTMPGPDVSPSEQRVLDAIGAMGAAFGDRLTKVEKLLVELSDAIAAVAEQGVAIKSELQGRLDDLRSETQTLGQAAMGARIDAEKAERSAAAAISQRDDAVRVLARVPDFLRNGNGHAHGEPPPAEPIPT